MKKSQFFLDRESTEQRIPPYRFRQKSMILDKFNVFGTIRRCYLNHLWTRICLNIYRFYYRKQILLKILVHPGCLIERLWCGSKPRKFVSVYAASSSPVGPKLWSERSGRRSRHLTPPQPQWSWRLSRCSRSNQPRGIDLIIFRSARLNIISTFGASFLD